MNSYNLITRHGEMCLSVGLLDDIIDMGFAKISYSKDDPTTYGTNAVVDRKLTDLELGQLEKKFKELNKKCAIFFEVNESAGKIIEYLEGFGYKKSFEESWQFWADGNIDDAHFADVKEVSNSEELEEFIDVFDKSFQKDDPINPYGDQGYFLSTARSSWQQHHSNGKLKYFLVYKDDKPVAVSALTSFEGLGYISDVGSLPEVRGQGFGKAATLFAVSQSINNGNQKHYLITEEGHYPNEFYKRIGFKSEIKTIAYAKSDII